LEGARGFVVRIQVPVDVHAGVEEHQTRGTRSVVYNALLAQELVE